MPLEARSPKRSITNGNALLGTKIKQNGKYKIHTAGKADVFAEVNNGKVVGVSATGMQVKKVKTRQKLAEPQTVPGLTLTGMQVAQTDVCYYGSGSTTQLPITTTGSRLTSSSITRGSTTFHDCRDGCAPFYHVKCRFLPLRSTAVA